METVFKIPELKKGYKLDLPGTSVYYFDIDHNSSNGPNYLSIFNSFMVENNWHQFVAPGSTTIDIGAHTGDTTIILQYLSRGTTLAVEPIPFNYEYTKFNGIVNSHLGKIITVEGAVTTSDDVVLEIYDHNNNLLNGGVIDPNWSPELQAHMRGVASQGVRVHGMTLETICKRYLTNEEINNISFIKSDTEGHDVSIIRSSKDFIDRIRPILFIEWFSGFGPKENTDMFQLFEEVEYTAFDPQTLEPADINKPISDLVLIHKEKIKDYI